MPPKRELKPGRTLASAQERRREEVLRKQKESRRGHFGRARELLGGGSGGATGGGSDGQSDSGGEEENTGGGSALPVGFGARPQHAAGGGGKGQKGRGRGEGARRPSSGWKGANRGERVKARRRFWASSVTTPEWMVDVPSGLNGSGSPVGAGWFVRPRPEGKRCLVTASAGTTKSRTLDGALLHTWHSPLPFGSPATASRQGTSRSSGEGAPFVVLDCVFDDATATYWVLDGMVSEPRSELEAATSSKLL